eukprot:401263_1
MLTNVTLFDNRLSCKLPPNLMYKNLSSNKQSNAMFLLGNRFETDYVTDQLPDYINENFRKATNLYLTNLNASIDYSVIGFSFFVCFILIISYKLRSFPSIIVQCCYGKQAMHKYTKKMASRKRSLLMSSQKSKSTVFAFANIEELDLSTKIDLEQFILPDEYEPTSSHSDQY